MKYIINGIDYSQNKREFESVYYGTKKQLQRFVEHLELRGCEITNIEKDFSCDDEEED